nr:lanthionine synthetase LanC family protein [Clostridium chrysemydis]
MLELNKSFDNNNILKDIIKTLLSLTEEFNYNGTMLPNFFIIYDKFIEDGVISDKKCELLDQGMAHGISGPLSFLSLSLKDGIEMPGQKESIKYILNFLKIYNYENELGIWWYGRLTLGEFKKIERSKVKNRASWCYGSPSIARSIFIASNLLKDSEGSELSLRCFNKLCSLSPKDLLLISPTICHGLSGLIMILTEMYRDTNKNLYKLTIDKYISELLTFNNSNYILNFQNYDVENVLLGKTNIINKNDIGLIDGSLGVLLTLLDYLTPNCNSFKRIFLIN